MWISFEILAASVISSKQVQDLQEMNPVFTSCDVKLLSACTAVPSETCPSGLVDKASASGAGDREFESRQECIVF